MALMARMRVALEDRWRVKAACLRLLAGAPLSGAQRRLIGQCVDIYLPLNARDEQALAAEVARLPGAAKEVVMELITSWERKGRAEGLREGRAEGLREGRAEGLREGRAEGLREGRAEGLREGQRLVVERMLTRRFGTLPPGMRARLARLTESELTALADALLDFTSLAEVEAWLATPPTEQA
jgi:flagellar biosynthesis/type III secretory pathway protein FliH